MNPQSPYPAQPGVPPALPQPYPLMGQPPRRKGRGVQWLLVVPLIVFILISLSVSGFALWAFGERNDYKNNSDKKSAAAAEIARQQAGEEKEKEFLEREKNPYKEYKGPSAFGSLDVLYPKTWAAYIDETKGGNLPVDGHFHPNFVPGLDSETAFALKVEVVEQPYDQVLAQFESDTKSGKVRVSPFKAAKVPSVLGARVDGQVTDDFNGSAVVFPLRDKTIKVSTQSQQFISDFDNIILPNLNFVP